MHILCHRGWWTQPGEKNSPAALDRAFAAGLGVETDLRDLAGSVVISHDPPVAPELDLAGLLALHERAPQAPLALNVKADGLARPVADLLAATGVAEQAFVFDMAVPDQLHWLAAGVAVFTRHSDVEPDPVLYAPAAGVWLDDFGPTRWWDAGTIRRHLDAGKRVAVVSPELHGRPHVSTWEALHQAGIHHEHGVLLCTDLPDAALELFR